MLFVCVPDEFNGVGEGDGKRREMGHVDEEVLCRSVGACHAKHY